MDDSDRRLRTDSVRDGDDEDLKNPLAGENAGQAVATELKEALDRALETSRLEAARRRSEAEAPTPPDDGDKARVRAEVRERIAAEHRRGNSRPIAELVGKEAALNRQSTALAKLANSERAPDENLLVNQLTQVGGAISGNSHLQQKISSEVVALYDALQSRDAIESMLDRVFVATDMATMDSFGRASRTNDPRARKLNLRFGMKGAQTLIELIKLRDARRGGGSQKVVVGKVNVQSGGQAIVGAVKTTNRVARKAKRRKGSRAASEKTKD